MTVFTPADKLHRLVKHALDSGAAASIAEAEAIFAGYRVALRVDDAHARDPHHQAALLTAVALARRVFLGGVTVAGCPTCRCSRRCRSGSTLPMRCAARGRASARLPTARL